MAKHPIDHLALVAADAERSLAGLSHSLKRGPMGMSQGALHSRDLASALSALGLNAVSEIADDMARQMLMGQPSILELAQSLVPQIAKAVRDIQLGEPAAIDLEQEQWQQWTQRLQALEASRPGTPAGFEVVVPRSASAPPPRVPAAESAVPGISTQASGVLPSNDPGLQALRRQGLSLIEQARISNQQDSERSIRQIDALLSELQDWTVRLGQVALTGVYAQPRHSVTEVWLDPAILEQLQVLDDLAARAGRIQAHSRSLVVYMDWHEVDFSIQEMDRVAECMQSLRGHVRRVDQGLRLTFPSSLARVRVLPFSLNGQLYAASAAQLLQVKPADEGQGQQQLLLRSGQTAKSLLVDHVMPQKNMNIFDVPEALSRPAWLWAVALDGSGDVHFCVTPV